MKSNQIIRDYARSKGVYLYEVAEVLNISEPTITRRLRVEMSDDEKRDIIAIIDRIAVDHAEQIRLSATATQ